MEPDNVPTAPECVHPLAALDDPYAADADATASRAMSADAVAEAEAEAELDAFRRQVDDCVSKTDALEKTVNEVLKFFDGKKHGGGGRKVGGTGKYGAHGVVPDLMRQFGAIIRQITSHEWAGPFLKPVDVIGLQLDDYYKIITKPMDFSTIQSKMEGKDGFKYNNVREIYSDVRLIFSNAMRYNDEQHDVHIMAKTLLEKFEEKWLQLLPRVENEEKKQKERSNGVPSIHSSREETIVKLAKDTDNGLNEINKQLEELRKTVVQRCRKMTIYEKRKLGAGISQLAPEDIDRALQMVAEGNPSFQNIADVELNMDLMSETTLWRLKFFVKEALEGMANNPSLNTDENAKRKKEICNALIRTASKRMKNEPS